MYPYSWRSSHNRMMHLCVDSIGDWRWSAPFDIDSDRGCTRSIKHSTHSSLVHVEIRKTGGLQKQVVYPFCYMDFKTIQSYYLKKSCIVDS